MRAITCVNAAVLFITVKKCIRIQNLVNTEYAGDAFMPETNLASKFVLRVKGLDI